MGNTETEILEKDFDWSDVRIGVLITPFNSESAFQTLEMLRPLKPDGIPIVYDQIVPSLDCVIIPSVSDIYLPGQQLGYTFQQKIDPFVTAFFDVQLEYYQRNCSVLALGTSFLSLLLYYSHQLRYIEGHGDNKIHKVKGFWPEEAMLNVSSNHRHGILKSELSTEFKCLAEHFLTVEAAMHNVDLVAGVLWNPERTEQPMDSPFFAEYKCSHGDSLTFGLLKHLIQLKKTTKNGG